jgi:hypothetical protein
MRNLELKDVKAGQIGLRADTQNDIGRKIGR